MRVSITVTVGLLLLTSCSPAFSQPKTQVVAGGAASSGPSVAARASLKDLTNPKNEFKDWVPSASPPPLDCPKGAAQERRTTEGGWETWCARGGVKHGPARSFERAARRELRQTFTEGALSGWSSEITLRPTLSVSGSPGDALRGVQNIEELTKASAELVDWTPTAAPPKLSCPEGTSQGNEVFADHWLAECRRPDGSVHGPSRMQLRDGDEHRTVYVNGVLVGQRLTINDGRTVRDVLHEKGAPVRAIERGASSILTLELTRGDARVFVRFYPVGGAAQLSRFKRGARHGEWRWWHENGQLSETRTYQNGEELPGGQRFDMKGTMTEVRKLKEGTGTIEQVNPGRSFEKTVCEMKAGKNHGHCRTTATNGQILDDTTYVEGVPLARKSWWESGQLRTDWVNDPKTGDSKQTNYGMSGRVEQVSECHGDICKTTVFDDKGNPTPITGRGTPTTDDFMREVEDML